MRRMIGCALTLAMTLTVAPRAFGAACELSASDLQNRRAVYDAACDAMSPPRGCTTAGNHGRYVSCVAQEANADASLPKSCHGAVVKCAAKSTCGKPSAVTCCRTKANGTTKCSTKSQTSACKAPKGGNACVSTHASCCDACTATGCASPSGAFLDRGGF